MGQWTWWRGTLVVGAFSASFILLLKISRSSSMSEKPAGGAFLLEAWRIAGMVTVETRRLGGRSIEECERRGVVVLESMKWRGLGLIVSQPSRLDF